MSLRTEPLYVLYGSQMGNSEQAAKDFCEEVKKKYTADYFEQEQLPTIQVETKCMQLDDFLEIYHANYTKCLVIFVSSYGVGQAPLGAYRFRELCEEWKDNSDDEKILSGLKYALCGLGDSGYTTYLKNPTTIDAGLTAVGATRLGEMGKADAKGMGEKAQDKVISRWVSDLWKPLGKSLADESDIDVKEMQKKTIPVLMKLDPDYTPPKELQTKKDGMCALLGLATALLGVGLALIASAALEKEV